MTTRPRVEADRRLLARLTLLERDVRGIKAMIAQRQAWGDIATHLLALRSAAGTAWHLALWRAHRDADDVHEVLHKGGLGELLALVRRRLPRSATTHRVSSNGRRPARRSEGKPAP